MNKYQALLRVLDLGSFTKAADELGYSQSAMSQMVHALEKELNTQLIVRHKKNLQLTDEGKLLLPYISDLAAGYDRLARKAQEIYELETGTIRIGTFTSISCHVLPDYLRDFHQQYPKINIELMHGNYGEIESMIRSGEVDFGFLDKTSDDSLVIEPFRQDHLFAVVPKGHPLAEKKSITPEELYREPFILPIVRDKATDDTLHSSENSPNVFFSVQDDYTIMSMVEKGLGVSILPETVLSRSTYELEILNLSPDVIRNITIAYKSRDLLPNAAQRFIKMLRKI